MKVTDYFEKAKGETLISFEILPPIKGRSIESIFQTLDGLMEFKPPFVDVTYHREDYEYKLNKNGFYEKVAMRKRPGTVGICTSIMHRYGVDAVPHLLCGGFTIQETEDVLIDLHFLNIQNVLALRGDKRHLEPKFIPEKNGHAYALDLVKQIECMNKGVYLDDLITNGQNTDFCIGIAGYPEKHFEAANESIDIANTKKKVDAGADYIVTQMFFDNQKYFDYVDKCRAAGINVPIVPGLKPLTKRYQLQSIPRLFFANLPEDLTHAIETANSDDAIQQIGMEWCIKQSKELKAAGVPCLHYYTMGKGKVTQRIAEAVF